MLAQDVKMWAFNVYWLIGFLIFLSLCGVVLTAVYIGIRMYLFSLRQRRSMAEYYRRTRRADGRMYPPFTGGICDQCGGIRKKVYHLKTGERLCPECYEPFWRTAEGWAEPVTAARQAFTTKSHQMLTPTPRSHEEENSSSA